MFERTVYRIPAVQRKLGGVNENRAAYQLFVARFRPELEPQMGLHSTNHRIRMLSQGFTKFYGSTQKCFASRPRWRGIRESLEGSNRQAAPLLLRT